MATVDRSCWRTNLERSATVFGHGGDRLVEVVVFDASVGVLVLGCRPSRLLSAVRRDVTRHVINRWSETNGCRASAEPPPVPGV